MFYNIIIRCKHSRKLYEYIAYLYYLQYTKVLSFSDMYYYIVLVCA